jgi:protein FrlC
VKLVDTGRISGMNVHYYHYSLDYFLDCQRDLGLRSVELLGGSQGLWLDHGGFQDPEPVRAKLERRGLSCCAFTPDNCFYGYQFAVREPEAIDRCFDYFAAGIRFGAALGAKIICVHPGWGYWNEPEEDAFRRSVDMHRRLSRAAGEEGVRLACESLRPPESLIGCCLEQLKRLFDAVASPYFKVMIDLTAISVSAETIQQWFDIFGAGNIIHSHFQDCTPYGHLVWGDGKYNLRAGLETMLKNGYTGYFTQELTDASYFADPLTHDRRNLRTLRLYAG